MNTNPMNNTNTLAPNQPAGGGGDNNPTVVKAATVIQTVIRGYQARNLLKHKLTKLHSDRFFNLIRKKTGKLMQYVQKLAEKVENAWKKSLISQKVEVKALHELEDVMENLIGINKDSRIWDALSHIEKEYLNEAKELFNDRFEFCLEDVNKTAESVGHPDLKKGIKFLLGDDWKAFLSPVGLKTLEQYNLIFTPTAQSLFYETDSDEMFGIELHNNENQMIIMDEGKFEMGRLIARNMLHFKATSGTDKAHGAELLIPLEGEDGRYLLLIVKGQFKRDPINMGQTIDFVQNKREKVKQALSQLETIPKDFLENYLNVYPLRDLISKTPVAIRDELNLDYKVIEKQGGKLVPTFVMQFARSPIEAQVRMFSLLLMKENPRTALFLYELIARESPDYQQMLRNTLHHSLQKKLTIMLGDLENLKREAAAKKGKELPYETQIAFSKMSPESKEKAFEKLEATKGQSSEKDKALKYLKGLLKIPFGVYTPEKVTMNSSPEEIKKHLDDLKKGLDDAVYGQEESKKAILEWRAQKIANGDSNGECIALEGPPGTGKTTFAREGLAKALGRPFGFISMGGQTDSSYLVGHGYTYVGSMWGKIIDIIKECGSMDPIIYIDEIDKVSQTPKGEELIGVLTALTDFSQNKEFQDKYFSGIKFDLSKVLFVFSYNDPRKLNPIFKDRLKVIKVDPLTQKDKIEVANRHLLPEIVKACGFEYDDIIMDDEDLKFLIEYYTYEAGARKLKENLFSIVRQINLKRLIDPDSIMLPYRIDRESVIKFRDDPKIEYKQIAKIPSVGMVNGLYATTAGIGGITIIQAYKTAANQRLELLLTGSQGDVMKESMSVARTVAWNLISDEVKEKIQKNPPEGLHIHCPEGSTPKDGPSAGGAITTAIVSQLTGIPIKNDVAMTGEIDLTGRITKIGGLSAKLHGAKKAGVTLALVPSDNAKDLEKIMKKDPDLVDETFQVKIIYTIHDALDNALVKNPIPRPPELMVNIETPPGQDNFVNSFGKRERLIEEVFDGTKKSKDFK